MAGSDANVMGKAMAAETVSTQPAGTWRQICYGLLICVVLGGGVCCEQRSEPGKPKIAETAGMGTVGSGDDPASAMNTGVREELPETLLQFAELSGTQFPTVIPRRGEEHGYATILESLGGGVAASDLDRDGWPDALIAGGGSFEGRRVLGRGVFVLRNRGERFQDETSAAGMSEVSLYHHGLATMDADQDGFQDLLITGYGGVEFWRNEGDGTFTDWTAESGLRCPVWCSSAAWGDFNGDGHPDVYVAGYVDWSMENDPPCYAADGVTRDNCSPKLFQAVPDFLYLSRGDGTFEDGTQRFGVRSDGKALGVVAADIDADGFTDVYVGNDVMLNFLYRNVQGQRFEDHSVSSGSGVSGRGSPDASMGVEVADYDRDGRFDLWAANFEMESFALYRNQGNMMFRHMSDATGISAIGEHYVGWGTAFRDFDLDGDPDVVVCNGNVVKYPQHSPALQRMLLLENMEGNFFVDVSERVGGYLMRPQNGRGLAVTDWNRDGRMDLLVSPVEFPAALLENRTTVGGHWLAVQFSGRRSPRQPVGVIVELETSSGVQRGQLNGGGSYASSHLPEVCFGWKSDVQAEKLTIRWPSGEVQTLQTGLTDVRLVVIEPTSGSLETENANSAGLVFADVR